MDLISQIPCHSPYFSAPSSPGNCSLSSMQFYSAPTSPIGRAGHGSFGYESSSPGKLKAEDVNSNFGDLEFEASDKFGVDGFEFETSQRFGHLWDDHQQQQQQQQHRQQQQRQQRWQGRGSVPTMAYADELFSDGQVMPLKLPPRLQCVNDTKYFSQCSTASSPRSPGSVLKMPFSWRSNRNDEFDPFMVALEKVKEGKRRKSYGSHPRRARSLSPFRTTSTPQWSNDSGKLSQHCCNQGSPLETMQHPMGPKPTVLVESRGSAYARWVMQHNKQIGEQKSLKIGPCLKNSSKPKGWPFARRVKSMTMSHEAPVMPNSTTLPLNVPKVKKVDNTEKSGVKGFLKRYASFGKQNNEGKLSEQIAALWKPIYFRRLSFKFKGNAKDQNRKKKNVTGESKIDLNQVRPSVILCWGYGIESPRVSQEMP